MKAGHDTSFKGVEIYVKINNAPRLNEYDDVQAPETMASKTVYLECLEETDKTFRIVYQMAATDPHTAKIEMDMKLDGRPLAEVCEKKGTSFRKARADMYSTAEGGQPMRYQLGFGHIHLVEEKTSSDATQIGTIKVTLSQGIIETTGSKGEFRVMETTVGPVNGKEKKVTIDRVIVGIEGKPAPKSTRDDCDFTPFEQPYPIYNDFQGEYLPR